MIKQITIENVSELLTVLEEHDGYEMLDYSKAKAGYVVLLYKSEG